MTEIKVGYARCSTAQQDLTVQKNTLIELGVLPERIYIDKGMAIAKAKGKLRGKQPKLSDKQQKELCRMHGTGQYSISNLAELFSVSRPTVYRTLSRNKAESS